MEQNCMQGHRLVESEHNPWFDALFQLHVKVSMGKLCEPQNNLKGYSIIVSVF